MDLEICRRGGVEPPRVWYCKEGCIAGGIQGLG